MTKAALPAFDPPSPGAWELEQTHITRPVSVFMADIFPAQMMRGFADGTRSFGVLLDHLEVAVINRFVYMCPRPVGAPKSAKGPPPRLMFAILRRLHPEIRRRVKRAETVFRDRHWRRETDWWHNEVKPGILKEARALFQDDVTGCTTPQLIDHLTRATAFAKQTIYWHHRFNICTMLPVGDMVRQTMGWTGMPSTEILQALRGLSPASAGAVAELAAVREALMVDPDALALLRSGKAASEIISELTLRPTAVGPAVRAYIDVVGLRVLGGYDVSDHHAREHPEMLVNVFKSALTSNDAGRKAAAAQAIASVRSRVPEANRAAFDAVLEEAQFSYGLRDERIFFGDGLGMGVARRAILAAGERLQAQGRIEKATQLVDATFDEIVAMLEGRGGPSKAELAERTRYRLETSISSAPPNLGFPPSAPPPAEWLPDGAARLQRAIDLVLSLMFATRQQDGPKASAALKGFGVSPGVYEGPARVIDTIEQLPTVQKGEVLITRATGSTFNVVLPLIGALVTERGGSLSHAAIVAREYGLPGVVGCPGATTAIKTGMRVRVDGTTGEVGIAG